MKKKFYVSIQVEYEARIKGIYGTFSGRITAPQNYTMETIDNIVAQVKKFIKENSACIELSIDSLDYEKSKLCCRLIHDYDGYKLINWDGAEYTGNYNSVDKTTIQSKEIKKVVYDFVNRFNTYVASRNQEEN